MTVYYVDKNHGSASDSNAGTDIDLPWLTIGKANSTSTAGDTVHVRTGTYTGEQIKPVNDGTSANRINYLGYSSEVPVLTGVSICVEIEKMYITVDGFKLFKPTTNYFKVVNTTGGVFELGNCIIDGDGTAPSSGYADCDLRAWGSHIHHNTFQNPYRTPSEINEHSSIVMYNGANNCLIENNTFIDGPGHSQVELYGGAYRNIIKNNNFVLTGAYANNIYECVDSSIVSVRFNEYNVIEGNTFHCEGASLGLDTYHPIRLNVGNKYNIVRNNVLYDTNRNGIALTTKESVHTEYNTVYNNTIHDVGVMAHGGEGNILCSSTISGDQVRYNEFLNNILYAADKRSIMQIEITSIGTDIRDNIYRNNIVNSTLANVTKALHDMSVWDEYTISQAETAFPAEFIDNFDSDPLFLNVTNKDFHLTSASPARNAGTRLTTVTSANGSGTSFVVANPYFFMDGHGVTEGDSILVGSNGAVTVTEIVHSTKTITVDSSITWSNGDEIYLEETGTTPDLGALQYEGDAPYTRFRGINRPKHLFRGVGRFR